MGEHNGEEHDEQQPEIIVPPGQLAGVWANLAEANFTAHEFTIDFVRMDPVLPKGIVVARVSGSPLLVMELREKLERVWHTWTRSALPKEAWEGDDEVPSDS